LTRAYGMWCRCGVCGMGWHSFIPYMYLCCAGLQVTLCVSFTVTKQEHRAASSQAVFVPFGVGDVLVASAWMLAVVNSQFQVKSCWPVAHLHQARRCYRCPDRQSV
jgi:hypothetical protein